MSKNSPALCLREDDNLKFISFIRDSERKSNYEKYKLFKDSGVEIVFNTRNTKEKEYSKLERFKIEDAVLLADKIVEYLPLNTDMIGLEGFSYNSIGNSGLDIAGYAYCLRSSIYKKFGANKLSIFAPSQVKRLSGKGNANKEFIYNYFKAKNETVLKNNLFWQRINDDTIKFEKPVDDLIDSYLVQECAFIKFISES